MFKVIAHQRVQVVVPVEHDRPGWKREGAGTNAMTRLAVEPLAEDFKYLGT